MKFATSIVLLVAACIEGKAIRYGARKEASRTLAMDSMTLTAEFGAYPSYTGEYVPSGQVDVQFNDDGSFHIQLDISGVEADCDACGMHIHTGFTCDNATLVGPHYWNFDIYGANATDDPWNKFGFYSSDGDGTSTTDFEGDSGYGYELNVGRAAVLHDRNGTRIGCGILEDYAEEQSDDYSIPTLGESENKGEKKGKHKGGHKGKKGGKERGGHKGKKGDKKKGGKRRSSHEDDNYAR